MERMTIYPSKYSYSSNNLSKVVTESNDIKTRIDLKGFEVIEIAWVFKNEVELAEFEDFIALNLSNGLDNFEADFEVRGEYEEYAFFERLNVTESNSQFVVSTKILKKNSYCSKNILESLECMGLIQKVLMGQNFYYEQFVPCNFDTLIAIDCLKNMQKTLKGVNND